MKRRSDGWAVSLTQWLEPSALVEKNRTSLLRYPMIFVAAWWTVHLKLISKL